MLVGKGMLPANLGMSLAILGMLLAMLVAVAVVYVGAVLASGLVFSTFTWVLTGVEVVSGSNEEVTGVDLGLTTVCDNSAELTGTGGKQSCLNLRSSARLFTEI